MKTLIGACYGLDNGVVEKICFCLLGAKRLTTSGCDRQSRRQTSLPPVLLLIRNAFASMNTKAGLRYSMLQNAH